MTKNWKQTLQIFLRPPTKKSNRIRKLECLVGKKNLKNVDTGHMLDKPVIMRLLFGFLINLQIVRPKYGIQHFAKTKPIIMTKTVVEICCFI